MDFRLCGGSAPLTPMLFKGQPYSIYILSDLLLITIFGADLLLDDSIITIFTSCCVSQETCFYLEVELLGPPSACTLLDVYIISATQTNSSISEFKATHPFCAG